MPKRVSALPAGARVGQRLRIDDAATLGHGMLCDVLEVRLASDGSGRRYAVTVLPPDGEAAYRAEFSGGQLRTVRGKPLAPGHDTRRRQYAEKRAAADAAASGETLAVGSRCPACGGSLEKRAARSTGELHLGCDRYPSCTFTAPLAQALGKAMSGAPKAEGSDGAALQGAYYGKALADGDTFDRKGEKSGSSGSADLDTDELDEGEGFDGADFDDKEAASWDAQDDEETDGGDGTEADDDRDNDDDAADADEPMEQQHKGSSSDKQKARATAAAKSAEAAAKALADAVKRMQDAEEPDEDRIRIREIAREEAGKLDATLATVLSESLTTALEEAEARVHKALAEGQGGGYKGIEVKLPDGSMRKIEGAHKALAEVVETACILYPRNIYVAGPAGSGKTTLAHGVAESLGLAFSLTSLSGGATEGDLLGRSTPNLHDGARYYTPSPFVTRYREGGVILLDEVDGADANVLLALNAALANGHMTLPNGERVERHKDCVVIVAANTFGTGAGQMYVGRAQLDAAFLNRFAGGTFFVDYDREVEKRVAGAGKTPPAWLTRLWEMRDAVDAKRLRRVLSTREVIAVARFVAAGKPEKYAMERIVAAWSKPDLDAIGEGALFTGSAR